MYFFVVPTVLYGNLFVPSLPNYDTFYLYTLYCRDLDLITFWRQNWVICQELYAVRYICLFWNIYAFALLKYAAIKLRFPDPIARQVALLWQSFCASLVVGGMTEFWLLMKIIASNVSESTEKLTSERKSPVKQQILMHKTAAYRLVNGGITHQKQQISEKGDIAWQYIDT